MKTPVTMIILILIFCLFSAVILAVYRFNKSTTDLDQPNQTQTEIVQWANKAIVAIFNDGRNHYQNSSKYFTGDGWEKFQASFEKPKTKPINDGENFNFSAIASEPAVLVKEGVDDNDVYFWIVEMPIAMASLNQNEFSNKKLVIQAKIVRTPLNQTKRGIAIDTLEKKEQKGFSIELEQDEHGASLKLLQQP